MKILRVCENLEELNQLTQALNKHSLCTLKYQFTEEEGNYAPEQDFVLKETSLICFYKKDNLNTENLVGFVEFKSASGNYYFDFYFEVKNENYENLLKKYKNKKNIFFFKQCPMQEEMICFKYDFKF